MKCAYCPRRLRTKESRDRGYGLICGRKLGLIPKATPRHNRATTPVTPVTKPAVHPGQTSIPIQPVIPTEADMPTRADPPTPARNLPQIAVDCPTCQAAPGELCVSHGGTRPRRNDTHRSRTDRWNRRTTKEN
ncbi:zinc finger domain-containing protein [Streptomyces turgidiscabies]|uniref:zinc finger domain-containing protein n=1 Tax=Streptomyces turgidiscabies TaxID=85558 RepID=UPI0038F5EB54